MGESSDPLWLGAEEEGALAIHPALACRSELAGWRLHLGAPPADQPAHTGRPLVPTGAGRCQEASLNVTVTAPAANRSPRLPPASQSQSSWRRGSHSSAAHLNFTRDARTPGGRRGGSPGRGACSREAAGPPGKGRGAKLGRKKKKSNREVTHQPGSEVTSPCRATRAQSERASTPGPTAAVRRRRRRRGSPPVSKGPIRAGGRGLEPRPPGLPAAPLDRGGPLPPGLQVAGGCTRASVRLTGQWQRQALLFVLPRRTRRLLSALECCSSQEFDFKTASDPKIRSRPDGR